MPAPSVTILLYQTLASLQARVRLPLRVVAAGDQLLHSHDGDTAQETGEQQSGQGDNIRLLRCSTVGKYFQVGYDWHQNEELSYEGRGEFSPDLVSRCTVLYCTVLSTDLYCTTVLLPGERGP